MEAPRCLGTRGMISGMFFPPFPHPTSYRGWPAFDDISSVSPKP